MLEQGEVIWTRWSYKN